MAQRSESELLSLLRQRDEGAFEEFVRTYGGHVFSIALRMLGNHAEAEDIAQEIFITVFKRIDSFRGESSLSTWLYRVTVNHCKNRLKYLARRHHNDGREYDDGREAGQASARGLAGSIDRPDQIVEAQQTERLIQKSLGELDEDHRTILVLREIEGLTYEEIGEIMKLEAGTVKSKLHRARAAFMRVMNAPGTGGGSGGPSGGEGG